tara:strand:- start:187 stop:315 length:129 start_codon:yes stop_codon:yes gene_type:complete
MKIFTMAIVAMMSITKRTALAATTELNTMYAQMNVSSVAADV